MFAFLLTLQVFLVSWLILFVAFMFLRLYLRYKAIPKTPYEWFIVAASWLVITGVGAFGFVVLLWIMVGVRILLGI